MLELTFNNYPTKKHNGTTNNTTNTNARNGQNPYKKGGNTINDNPSWGRKGGFPHASFVS